MQSPTYLPSPTRGLDQAPREPLAVVGIGCRLPGGIDTPTAYWNALLAGLDAIRDVPEDRWIHSRFHDIDPEKSGCIRNAKGGFIDGVDQFDAEFFGYFPTEAQRLDPQQRLLLEVTHEAMEDAGLRRDQLDGSRTSVFIGSFMYDYLCIQTASEQRDEINPYVAMGTGITSLANRISYNFNLKGPSISLDTACSSSLVAVHLGCRSLWSGEADMAIVGGVNVMLRPESSIMLSKAGFLSPDQYCKAFDAAANGYVRGEGVGVVILKPLSRALGDRDAIYALVRGTAVNQDGFLPEGFTVPNVFSQIAMLRTAYAEAGMNPLLVDFVEAHGTGTAVGDPIECLALGAVLGRDRPPGQRCLLGSVKTNLGHLEGAAGIAGFIKGALTACHGIAAPNLHFHEPNPGIDFDDLHLEVPTSPTPLERHGHPLTVGVNSFGAGGTNAHVVLQEPAASKPRSTSVSISSKGRVAPRATLYVLSAWNHDALRQMARRHAEFLSTTRLPLDELAFSAFTRRSRYPQVLAVVGQSSKEIAEKLRKFADGQVDSSALATRITRKRRPKLCFVFSGQGGQWIGMGRQLLEREPIFRHTLEDIDAFFQELSGWSLLAELAQDEVQSRIDDTLIVQPAIMAIQIGLVKLYEHYGIRPQGVVGHSIGEVAAAFAAGALTLEDAVGVIYHRSQAQSQAAGKGGMLAIGLSFEEASKLLADIVASEPISMKGRVSIAAVNGPEMLTLSGDLEPLERIAHLLEARGVFNRPVRVQVPYHSYHMEPLRAAMTAALGPTCGTVATTPLYSTVSGRRETGAHLNAEYWYRNARQPVLFTAALSALLEDGYTNFIEIGPHPVLVGGAESLFQKLGADAVIRPSMTRRDSEASVFLLSLAQLAARGIEPDASVIFGADRQYVRLPNYPWQHSRYWFESPGLNETRRGRFEHPFLKRQAQLITEEGLAVWEASLDLQRSPFLRDHQVDGEIVFPATGHIELAWAVAREQFRHESFFLEKLQFESALLLPDNSPHPLQARLEITSGEGDYYICSRPAEVSVVGAAATETPWSKHSSGRINTTHDCFEHSTASLDELRRRFRDRDTIPVESFYEAIHKAGLAYGDKFRCIRQLWHQGHEMLAQLQLADELAPEAQRNAFHPALLDACLHLVFADVHQTGDPDRIYLPARVDRVRFYRKPGQRVWSFVRVTRNDEQYLCSDTLIFDQNGELVAEVLGLACKRLAGAGTRPADTLYDGCYEYRWVPAPSAADLHGRNFDCTRAVLITSPSAPWRHGASGEQTAAELAARLAADDIQVQRIHAEPRESIDQLLADVPLDRRTMIVFAALNDPRPGLPRFGWKGLAECPSIASLLQLGQALQKREGVPRVFVVTNGAAGVTGDEHLDLGQATLHGMVRVIKNECPNIPLAVIDLSESIPPAEVEALYHELLHCRRDRDESEIALRLAPNTSAGPNEGNDRGRMRRLVRQLVPIDRESAEQAASGVEPGVGGAFRAAISEPGLLDQVAFRRLAPIEPGPDEVEIAVQAAALNFKDIMNAMGMLPESAVSGGLASDRLGLEVAGRVLRAGRHVPHFHPGDEVIARVADGFSGRVIAPGHCVVKRPQRLTPQQAAAIPVVYITAWYSLCHLARMAPGETVLIHSAAGGVGGAAIQLAHRTGATVIATAGTKEKRAYLSQLGVKHVFDSRSLDFYNQVMKVTAGRGVDIVLNSLTGRFIAQSLKCLAPFGRFIEIGKADIYRNSKLSSERLGENISYFVVDVDRLAVQKPELHRQVMTEVVALFDRGELEPHEITEFPISKLPEAMKFMTRAAYRGKIVVTMENDLVQTLPAREAAFRPDGSYLITGGASGLGLEIARWMVDHGARHLVLASRSGCKTDADRSAVESMMERGITVLLTQTDVTDPRSVGRLMERIRSNLPPLAGVIHGAALLDDALISTMDMARFQRAFDPKAQGAWNLHEATLNAGAGARLDFFLMLSSISSVLGLYGQVNYAAANFFQDSLAQYRRQLGLPGTSINLGVLGSYAGMSSKEGDNQDVLGLLESHGLLVMPLAHVLAKLEPALVQQPVQRMTARLDWTKFRKAYPHLARDSRFIDLMTDAALGPRVGGSSLRATLSTSDPDARQERVQTELARSLERILGVTPGQLDVTASLDQLGLDSLMLSQLRNWVLRSLDINLPMIKLLKGPSIASLSVELLAQLNLNGSPGAQAANDSSQNGTTFTVADLEGVQILNPWLVRGRGNADAPFRLICFHSMGVGASLFTKFLLNPPADYDILAVQTPGRENRSTEAVVESVDVLADQVVEQLLPILDRPFVIWGHSFGGIVAGEVIRRLQNLQREPMHFVVTGTVAPHLIHLWQKREVLLKAMVADNSPEYLISLSRYVDDAEFIKAILPLMRRDYPLLRNYRFHSTVPFHCPIIAFAAQQDDFVYSDEVREWARYSAGEFTLIEVEGDHWFLNRNRELIIETFQGIATSANATHEKAKIQGRHSLGREWSVR